MRIAMNIKNYKFELFLISIISTDWSMWPIITPTST